MTKQLIGTGQISLTKVSQGAPGESAKYITINGDQIFRYLDSEMLTIPEPRNITLQAKIFNINSSDVKWFCKKASSSEWTDITDRASSAYTLTGTSSLIVDPNDTYWEDATSLSFSCVVDGQYYDEITVVKLAVGDSFNAILTNEAQTIPTNFDGSFNQSDLEDIYTDIKVFQGTKELTYNSNIDNLKIGQYFLEITESVGVSGVIDNQGRISLTYMSNNLDSGHLEITATIKIATDSKNDTKKISKIFSISKAKQGEEGAEGSPAKNVVITGENIFLVESDINKTITPEKITLMGIYHNLSSETKGSWRYKTTSGSFADITHKIGETEISHSDNNYSTLTIYPNALTLKSDVNLTIRLEKDGLYDDFSIVKLSETSNYTAILTNEAHTVSVDENGAELEGELDRAYTDCVAYKNTEKLTAVSSKSALGNGKFYIEVYSISPNDGNTIITKTTDSRVIVKDTNPFIPSVSATIRFYMENVNTYIDKVFSLSKSYTGKKGEDGEPAKLVLLNGPQVFKYSEGSQSPLPTSITLQSTVEGYDLPFRKWYVKKNLLARSEWELLEAETTSNAEEITIPYNDTRFWGSNLEYKSISIKCQVSDTCDEMSIIKVYDGEDGKDSISILLTNENHTFPANSEGGIDEAITVTTKVMAFKGTQSIVPTIGALPAVNGLTISSSGTTISITAKTGKTLALNGSFDIPISYLGQDFTKTFSWSKSLAGVDGSVGQDGLAVLLTNENYTFNADSGGKITETQTTYTDVIAMKGSNDLPVSFGPLPSVNGLSISRNDSRITITANTGSSLAKSGSFNIPITVDGKTFNKTFSWTKVSSGAKGDSAQYVVVNGEQVFKYINNSPTPSSITLTATKFNTTASGKWQYKNTNGTWVDWTTGGSVVTGTTLTVMPTSGILGSSQSMSVRYVVGTIYDEISIVKVSDGANGNGIERIVEYYAVSTSNTTAPTSWSTSVQQMTATNKYLWNYEDIYYTSGNSTSTAKRVIGVYGDKGNTGDTGATGNGIKSITNYYLASSSASGVTTSTSGWTTAVQTPTSTKKYLWNYEVINYTNSTKYTGTPRIIGNYAADGLNGVGITSVDVEYYLSTSSTTQTGGSWSTTAPAWVDGKYMWSRTKTVYTNGQSSTSQPVCITGQKGGTGATGTGITSITEEYYLSTSKTTQTGGSWSTTAPTWSSGKYLWTRNKIVYSNPTSTVYTTPICDNSWEAVNEIQVGGTNLFKGTKDFNSAYWSVWLALEPYENDATLKQATINSTYTNLTSSMSKQGFDFSDTSQTWTISAMFKGSEEGQTIGVTLDGGRIGYNQKPVSNGTWSLITWTFKGEGKTLQQFRFENSSLQGTIKVARIKVEKGNRATDYSLAPEDVQAEINKSVANVDVMYYLSTSSTSLTGGSWSTTAPVWADGKYMWSKTVTTLVGGSTMESSPTCIAGAKGTDGKGIKSIVEQYYHSTSMTSLAGGSWTTTAPTPVAGKYIWTRSVITYTDNTTTTTSAICTTGATGATGSAGKDAYTVLLTNESHTFPTANNGNIATALTATTQVIAYKGASSITPTIGTLPTVAGLTLSKSGTTITIQANTGTSLADSGYFSIPITVDGQSFTKNFSWTKAKAGATGATGPTGAAAKAVDIIASSQVFKSSDGGVTFSPSTITLTPKLQNLTYSSWQYSTNGGSSWNGFTTSITGWSVSSGVLTINKDCSLFTKTNTSVVFRVNTNDSSYYDVMTIVKLYDVSDIQIGGTNLVSQSRLLTNINKGAWTVTNTGNEGFKKLEIVTTDTSWQECQIPVNAEINSLTSRLTISFEYYESNAGLLAFSFGAYNGNSRLKEIANVIVSTEFKVLATEPWKRVSYTFDPTSVNGVANATRYQIQFKKQTGKTGTIYVRKPKLEMGTVATSWTSALDDNTDPNTTPAKPVITSSVKGFGSITLNWTFENKSYYTYRLYGSKTSGFTPGTSTLLTETKSNFFLHQVVPGETWYYKVCAVNSYGTLSSYSDQLTVSTKKMDSSTIGSYIANAAIGSALIGTLSADNIGAGTITTAKLAASAVTADKIAANTITADRMAIGDFTNFAQLNNNTAAKYGFTKQGDEAGGAWLKRNSMARDIFISDYYECNGGESFRIKYDISTTIKGNSTNGGTDSTYRGTAIGLYCYNGSGTSVGTVYSTRYSNQTISGSSSTVTIPTTARKFRVFIQTESYGNWSGELKVRNIQVSRMTNSELIVNGSITANMITSGTFQGTNFIAGGSTNGNGYIQVKDASNNVKFHASKNGVYATNIQFPDSISSSGAVTTNSITTASGSGFTSSMTETGTLYNITYYAKLTEGELRVSSSGTFDGASTSSSTTVSDSLINLNGTQLRKAGQNSLQITSKYGYITIGAENSDWLHFKTDRAKFWFEKQVSVQGEIYAGSSYNGRVYHTGWSPKSGAWWSGGAVVVGTDGVMEIGKYIDFHDSNTTTADYSARLSCSGSTITSSGSFTASGNLGTSGSIYAGSARVAVQASHGGLDVGGTDRATAICSSSQPTWWNGSVSRQLVYSENDSSGYPAIISNGGNSWIRTPSSGLIPNTSGTGSGRSNIGSDTWRFSTGYFNNVEATSVVYAGRNGSDYGSGFVARRYLSSKQQSAKCMIINTGGGCASILHRDETNSWEVQFLVQAWSASTGCVRPNNSGGIENGTSAYKWKVLYSSNGTIQTSDERFKIKRGFADTDDCFNMVKNIQLYKYTMLDKNKEDLTNKQLGRLAMSCEEEDAKVHIGIMAQDLQKYECGKHVLVEGDYEKEDGTTDTMLHINPLDMTMAVMGGLKKEIEIREQENIQLQEKVNRLEKKIEEIVNLLQ